MSANEDSAEKARLAGMAALSAMEPFLDTLDGFVAATRTRGFTEEQARAIVAHEFGYRPTEGETTQ